MARSGHRLGLALVVCMAAAAAVGDDGVCADATPVRVCSGPRTSQEFVARLGSDYDISSRPPCGNATHEGPTHVEVQLYLTQLNDVDQKLQQLTVNGYLRRWWRDPRLAFPPRSEGGCVDSIAIAGKEFDRIWAPDLYIDNIVEVAYPVGNQLLEISHDGSVWMSQQVTLQFSSPLDLGQLPYDRHVARITTASYSQDISRMRVTARGGTIGGSSSGVGIVAPPMTSSIWTFTDRSDDDNGFETLGKVEVMIGWDYLHLEFGFARQPWYLVQQVIFPSMIFLMLSYIQFWVDAGAAPARAALATIPLLIIRTMTNSVYESLPEGSQRLWLVDFLMASTILITVAGLEFAVVNFFLVQERRYAAELAGLQESKGVAEKLKAHCKTERISLLQLLHRCRPSTHHEDSIEFEVPQQAEVPREPPPTIIKLGEQVVSSQEPADVLSSTPEHADAAGDDVPSQEPSLAFGSTKSTGTRMKRVASHHVTMYSVKECDLLFIRYAERIFSGITDVQANQATPREIKKALKHFSIFMTTEDTAAAMSMFLRDEGEATPLDDLECTMTFSQFVFLLMNIKVYQTRHHPAGFVKELAHTYQVFFGTPPSKRVDILARVCFPLAVALQCSVLYLTIDQY